MLAIKLLDVAEQRAVFVEDDETRSSLLSILADKRKCLALLDQTLAAELQSFSSLSTEIQCDEVVEVSFHPARTELVSAPIDAMATAGEWPRNNARANLGVGNVGRLSWRLVWPSWLAGQGAKLRR